MNENPQKNLRSTHCASRGSIFPSASSASLSSSSRRVSPCRSSGACGNSVGSEDEFAAALLRVPAAHVVDDHAAHGACRVGDRKSTRLNSSHVEISYAVFCLKKKKINTQ